MKIIVDTPSSPRKPKKEKASKPAKASKNSGLIKRRETKGKKLTDEPKPKTVEIAESGQPGEEDVGFVAPAEVVGGVDQTESQPELQSASERSEEPLADTSRAEAEFIPPGEGVDLAPDTQVEEQDVSPVFESEPTSADKDIPTQVMTEGQSDDAFADVAAPSEKPGVQLKRKTKKSEIDAVPAEHSSQSKKAKSTGKKSAKEKSAEQSVKGTGENEPVSLVGVILPVVETLIAGAAFALIGTQIGQLILGNVIKVVVGG